MSGKKENIYYKVAIDFIHLYKSINSKKVMNKLYSTLS